MAEYLPKNIFNMNIIEFLSAFGLGAVVNAFIRFRIVNQTAKTIIA